LLTTPASVGLTPASLLATVLVRPLTVDPSVLPAAATVFPTAPVAFCTAVDSVLVAVGLVHGVPHPPVVVTGVDPVGETVDGADPTAPVRVLPNFTRTDEPAVRPDAPPLRAVPDAAAPEAVALTAATFAANSRSTREPVAWWGRLTTTAAGVAPAPTWGQPRNATTALARTNTIAAPASNEPAVPNPAMYALEARTSALNRQLGGNL
jgi:hypothetical protein